MRRRRRQHPSAFAVIVEAFLQQLRIRASAGASPTQRIRSLQSHPIQAFGTHSYVREESDSNSPKTEIWLLCGSSLDNSSGTWLSAMSISSSNR